MFEILSRLTTLVSGSLVETSLKSEQNRHRCAKFLQHPTNNKQSSAIPRKAGEQKTRKPQLERAIGTVRVNRVSAARPAGQERKNAATFVESFRK